MLCRNKGCHYMMGSSLACSLPICASTRALFLVYAAGTVNETTCTVWIMRVLGAVNTD